MSIGNQFVEIPLTKSKTTLISGSNGSGKSTLIEAIIFVLYWFIFTIFIMIANYMSLYNM